MIRTALWMLAGAVLGGIIHLVVILTLPALAEETLWTRVTALEARDRVQLLPPVQPGAENPFGLDPALVYGICQIDLTAGPGFMSGFMPNAFWSLAVFDRSGTVIYSTTNRDGIGQTLDLGIFNAAQTRLLAQQELDIEEGLLIVEARTDDLFIIVRLAPPNPAVRARYTEALSTITCGTME